jgi:hypothetical protein
MKQESFFFAKRAAPNKGIVKNNAPPWGND